jgi:hypothetical protein
MSHVRLLQGVFLVPEPCYSICKQVQGVHSLQRI